MRSEDSLTEQRSFFVVLFFCHLKSVAGFLPERGQHGADLEVGGLFGQALAFVKVFGQRQLLVAQKVQRVAEQHAVAIDKVSACSSRQNGPEEKKNDKHKITDTFEAFQPRTTLEYCIMR